MCDLIVSVPDHCLSFYLILDRFMQRGVELSLRYFSEFRIKQMTL